MSNIIIEPDTPEIGQDQTIKADAGKLQLHLVPTEIIRCIARVRAYGNKKYGDSESWRRVEPIRYLDAAWRHMLAVTDGGLHALDDESGLTHLEHLATNIAFLCEAAKNDTEEGEKE